MFEKHNILYHPINLLCCTLQNMVWNGVKYITVNNLIVGEEARFFSVLLLYISADTLSFFTESFSIHCKHSNDLCICRKDIFHVFFKFMPLVSFYLLGICKHGSLSVHKSSIAL